MLGGPHCTDVIEVKHARALLLAHADDPFEMRECLGLERAGLAVGQFRGKCLQHVQIVTAFELLRSDDGVALNFVERVFQLVGAIRGVNTHHNGADLGGGQLHQYPLATIGPPNTHANSRGNAKCQQASSQLIYLFSQLTVSQSDALMAHHQSISVGVGLTCMIEIVADRLVNNLRVRCAAVITMG